MRPVPIMSKKKKHITNHYFYLKTPRILTFTLGQWFNKSWRTNCAVLEKQAWQTTQPDSLLTSVSTRMSLPRLTFTVDSNLPLIALSRSSAKVCPISVPVMTFVRCTLRGILKFKHKCFFFFSLTTLRRDKKATSSVYFQPSVTNDHIAFISLNPFHSAYALMLRNKSPDRN